MAAVSEKARKDSVPIPKERTQGETIAYLLAALTIGAVGLYLIQDLFAPAFFALTLVVTRGREFVPDRLEGVPVLLDDSLGGLGPIGPAATLGVWRTLAERRRTHPEV